jgi:hypothetical protein
LPTVPHAQPEIFAEWQRRQGLEVVRTESSYWVEAGPHIFQSFPYHLVISPAREELDKLFHEHAAIGLRYSTGWDQPEGSASYHVVFTDHEYPISVLPKKTRPDVRKVLERGSVEQISFTRLDSEGWQLRAETLQRQGRTGAESREWWHKLCQSAEGLPGFEAWAAIVDGRLAAALLVFVYEDCCDALLQQSLTEYQPLGVNNALTFVFTNSILERPGNLWIFYGLHSLDAPPSVDAFKFHMRYTAKPVRQRVVFNPWLRPLFNPASHAALKAGLRLRPGNATLSKAEGMLRFYLQGRLPITQQAWPPPLVT